MADEAETRLGTRLGNYVLREIIGRGGMGVVYRGEHAYIKKHVAIKVLYRQFFDNPDATGRFLREAQAASAVNHPNIVGVTDFGEEPDGTVFLVMDHVEGQPLDRVLRAEKTISLFRTIVILSQVTRAVGEAHRKGIVHRDLKPENIMLQPRPERRDLIRTVTDQRGTLEILDTMNEYEFVTVLDFGAAKIWDPDAPPSAISGEPGTMMATPAYMAPETARIGVADARSDIYAVGVIFYQMLTGTLPFSGENAADVMMKQVHDAVEPPRARNPRVEITAEAERVILKALSKDPEQRSRTMDDFYADLQRCYGSVRFRRTDQPVLDGLSLSHLRKPIPLTREKRPSSQPAAVAAANDARATPTGARLAEPSRTPALFRAAPAATPGPVPSAVAPGASAPIPLTKRKGDKEPERRPEPRPEQNPERKAERKSTLPFGVGTPEPGLEADEPERHRTSPYGELAPPGPDVDEDAPTPPPQRKR